jgi:carbon starvation protein CstA
MTALNKVDKEILEILRVVFLTTKVNPMQSDDHMRLWIIRSFFALSVFGLLARIAIGFSSREVSAEISVAFNMPIAIFFGVLFLHINNESENTSLIVFALTWLSIVIGLYV